MNTPDFDRPGHPTIPAEANSPEPDAAPVDAGDDGHGAAGPATPLRWPPPGLGRVQGDAYLAARWLGAGALLVLPLLAALVLQTDPWVLGIGDGFALALLLGFVGIPILIGGFLAVDRLMDRSREAARHGYDWRLIALTACDQRGDTGFLVQGERAYSALSQAKRRMMARLRVLTGALFLGGAMWLSFGFALAVVLAARGLLGPGGVALWTLGPSAVAAGAGVILYAWEETLLRRARKSWHAKPWNADLEAAEIRAWKAALADREGGLTIGGADDAASTVRGLRVAGIATGVAMLATAIPIFLLIIVSTIAPILAAVSMPSFSRVQEKSVHVEALRPYVLEPDPGISAREAGEILHVLSYAGEDEPVAPGLREPVRRYQAGLLPERPEWLRDTDHEVAWFLELLSDPAAPLEPAAEQYLATVAAHPGHRELERVARASDLDLSTARFQLPLPADLSFWSIPLPKMGGVRRAAYAHVGKATLEARRGQYERAETTLREVLSAGVLLSDHGMTLLDNLVGTVVAGVGRDGLERLYRATGRETEADALAREQKLVERAAEVAGVGATPGMWRTLRAFPALATDTLAVPGLRWEAFAIVNAMSPCMNPRRIVFGPDDAHAAWLERARPLLVGSEADAALFELAQRGGWPVDDQGEHPPIPRFIALTMGGIDREGSCGRVMMSLMSGG